MAPPGDPDRLTRACADGDPAAVRLLLDGGADVAATEGEALRAAAACRNTDIVRMLLRQDCYRGAPQTCASLLLWLCDEADALRAARQAV